MNRFSVIWFASVKKSHALLSGFNVLRNVVSNSIILSDKFGEKDWILFYFIGARIALKKY